MLKNKKKNSSSITKKIHKSIKRVGLISLSTLLLVIIINVIISKTTGVNVAKKTYDYIAKAVNSEKTIDVKNTEVIESVETKSDAPEEPGAWLLDKSAEWIELNKAKVTFNVDTELKTKSDNRDVILVIDISGSSDENELDKEKEDAIELVEVLLSNKKNRVALITFDYESEIVSDFTNNKADIINKINSLNPFGETNYNQALKKVNSVMDGYKKEKDKDVVTVFLTYGHPKSETTSQVGSYELLKDKYPYMTINSVQYGMGKDIIEEIKQISDNQWAVNRNTSDNVLFEASGVAVKYENFEVVEYINKENFILDEEKDIEVSVGTVKVEKDNGYEKVIWNLDSFVTGNSATMDIYIELKDGYKKQGGYYQTIEKEEVNYKFANQDKKQVKSNKAPVLKHDYTVIYDTNTPEGCELDPVDNELHFVYDKVSISKTQLSCEGYNFKGWEILEEDVKNINDNVFVMTPHDVNVRGIWAKPSVEKEMDGMLWHDKYLYDLVEREATKTNGEAAKYEGPANDAYGASATRSVYYYTGENNNVIFGDFCWKIIRTTTTGGVKILYSGKANNGQCTATKKDAIVGMTSFNRESSAADVGYMYNKRYSYSRGYIPSDLIFSNDVSYDGEYYTLSNDRITGVPDNTHHYTCGEVGETKCKSVRYYYYYWGENSYSYYLTLNGDAKNIQEALNQMLYATDVNKNNSSAKSSVDNWYKNNIYGTKYANQLEDTIFCNDRSISDLGGFDPNGGNLKEGSGIIFTKYGYIPKDLTCKNDTDKFSTKNSRAKLTYPVGLMTAPEAALAGWAPVVVNEGFWLGTPAHFGQECASVYHVYDDGLLSYLRASFWLGEGIRPVVSLRPGTKYYVGGRGTKTNPYVIVSN